MKRLVLAVLIGFSIACDFATPVKTKHADDNPQVEVALMATFDGIRLYRVKLGEDGSIVFVAVRVASGEASTQWTVGGKPPHTERVQTLP